MIKTQLTMEEFLFADKHSEYGRAKELQGIMDKLKALIKKGVILTSDTYFNIAYHREPKIRKNEKNGMYQLYFAQSSDSERLLSAYEANKNIKPLELLGVGLPKGVLDRLELHIKDNPSDTTINIFNFFRIWDYPTYRWVHAEADTLEELLEAKEIIVEWAKIKEELELSLEEGRFSFMRTNKRTKFGDQTAVIPQCFDGMCLEKNFMKLIAGSQVA